MNKNIACLYYNRHFYRRLIANATLNYEIGIHLGDLGIDFMRFYQD
jgi:hypothetical protein